MLILGACVVSSVVSVIVVRYNKFRMYKDTADKGYKINTKKVLNNTNQNKRKHNYKNLLLLFPIVNLFIAADKVIKYNYFRMYKDVSDKGYKINIKNITNEIKPNKKKTNYKKLLLLLPVINIFVAANKVIKYNKVKPYLVDSLKSTSFIEKMNDEEKEYYKSNPSINTAVNVVVYSRYKEEKMKHQDNSDEKIIGIKEAGQILNKSKSKMLIKTKKI